ncbi:MAG: hypothetical protein A3F68_01680 [Acidobacteria bacterium RIFCSPLOWO2_12_FULL_54_10]|nr:MAG: hypothetical protein A3F68_01680 [Acidobacteria bacterium RIFCSPLOWO2_12_FULL_54_10]
MSSIVSVTDSAVNISSLTLDSPDVIQYFKQLPEEDRHGAAIRAFEIGVFCLQRVQMGHGLDFVRLEVQKLIQSAENAISKVPKLVEEKLGGETGPLAPVRTAVTGAQNAIHQKLNEVGGLFSQHLDPANAETTLGRALTMLRDLTNPERSDSVQQRIGAAIATIAQTDGTLVTTIKREVENATSSLREAVNALTVAYAGKKGAEEALEETTVKGEKFEHEETLPIIRDWAQTIGAEFQHIGPQNQPGDFLINMKDTGMGPCALNLVVEARDQKDRFGRSRIAEHMNNALNQWKGNYGIYLSKTESGLGKEIGEWHEMACHAGPIIACTFEHLRTALRFAVVDFKFKELLQSRREIDAASIGNNLGRFRTSLNHLTQIKSKVTAIRGPLGEIESEADSMRSEINNALQDIETALPK